MRKRRQHKPAITSFKIEVRVSVPVIMAKHDPKDKLKEEMITVLF